MTRISVLIPCYNAARYVAAALESVLAQDYQNFEVIVVDDGSTDGSAEVLRLYKNQVKVATKTNGGAAAARNAAFAACSGDLVLFLDADDLIGPGHLAALAGRQIGLTVAMAAWDRFHIDPAEAAFPNRAAYRDAPGVEWLAKEWQNAQPMMQPGMFLIPRALIERHGGWDERLSLIDDFEFFARILSHCEGIRFADGARLYYRSAVPGSLSGRKSRKALESQFLSLMLGTSHLLAVDDGPLTRRACANVLKSFNYEHYPQHPDLRAKVCARVAELGGADIAPSGPPRFHMLRRYIGWRAARRVQKVMGR